MSLQSIDVDLRSALEESGVTSETIELVEKETNSILDSFTVDVDTDDIGVSDCNCLEDSDERELIDQAWWDISVSGFLATDVLHELFKNCSGYSCEKLGKLLKGE